MPPWSYTGSARTRPARRTLQSRRHARANELRRTGTGEQPRVCQQSRRHPRCELNRRAALPWQAARLPQPRKIILDIISNIRATISRQFRDSCRLMDAEASVASLAAIGTTAALPRRSTCIRPVGRHSVAAVLALQSAIIGALTVPTRGPREGQYPTARSRSSSARYLVPVPEAADANSFDGSAATTRSQPGSAATELACSRALRRLRTP